MNTNELTNFLLSELRAGRRVLVAAESWPVARELFKRVAEPVAQALPSCTLRRAAGQEAIRLPGGPSVVFGSVSSRTWRGRSADTLVIDARATVVQRASIAPCLLASQEPQLVEL